MADTKNSLSVGAAALDKLQKINYTTNRKGAGSTND